MTFHETQTAATAITFTEWNNMVTWLEKNAPTHPSGTTADYVLEQTTATVTLDSTHHLVFCDTTGNPIAITLPDVASNIGQRYIIILETDPGANDVTVVCAGTDTYIGAGNPAGGTTATLVAADDYLEIVAVQTTASAYWMVLGLGGAGAGIL